MVVSVDIPKTLILHKKQGETSLACIERFRANNPQFQGIRMGYAGKLDPMADGVLLVLCGEENKNREHYFNLDKKYNVEILFGFETDTYDMLGLVLKGIAEPSNDIEKKVTKALQQFRKTYVQPYPPFSSKPAYSHKEKKSRMLLEWTLLGRLDEVEIPSREVTVYDITVQGIQYMSSKELQNAIARRLHGVDTRLRTQEIQKRWDDVLQKIDNTFPLITISVYCSSGTYMRHIAHELGKQFGCGAIAWSITRTAVGEYTIKNSKH